MNTKKILRQYILNGQMHKLPRRPPPHPYLHTIDDVKWLKILFSAAVCKENTAIESIMIMNNLILHTRCLCFITAGRYVQVFNVSHLDHHHVWTDWFKQRLGWYVQYLQGMDFRVTDRSGTWHIEPWSLTDES